MIRTNGTTVQVKKDVCGEYLMGTAMRRTKLDGRTQVDYDDYTLLRGEDSYSCVGYTRDERERDPMYATPKKKEKSMVKDAGMVWSGDDFGPQRFCPNCGVKLVQIFNPLDEDEYKHPYTGECDQDGLIVEEPSTGRRKKERMVRTDDEDLIDNIVLRYWKPSIPKTRAQLIEFNRHFGKLRAAIAGHNKQVAREKEGKSFSNPEHKPLYFLNVKKTVVMYFECMSDEATTKWLKDNWDALTLKAELPDEPDTLPLLYNKDGELITDPNPDDVSLRWDAPIELEESTRYTKEEAWLMGRFDTHNGQPNVGYVLYVLPYNPYKVKARLRTTSNVRPELREHLNDICDIFIETGFRHPKLERRNKKYARNWEELQQMVWAEYYDIQKKTSTPKPKTVRAQYVRVSK